MLINLPHGFSPKSNNSGGFYTFPKMAVFKKVMEIDMDNILALPTTMTAALDSVNGETGSRYLLS